VCLFFIFGKFSKPTRAGDVKRRIYLGWPNGISCHVIHDMCDVQNQIEPNLILIVPNPNLGLLSPSTIDAIVPTVT